MTLTSRTVKKLAIAASAIPLVALVLSVQNPMSVFGEPEDAAALYKAKCASCHAADGSGSTTVGKSLKVRDLRSEEVQKQSDDQLFEIIAKGKGKMPAYEKSLGADKCKALVAYTRELAKKK